MRALIAVLAMVMATGCSYNCPVGSHGVDLGDGGQFACEADECYQPAGPEAADGFVANPQDRCGPDAGLGVVAK